MADKPKKSWVQSATTNSHGQFKAKAEKAGMSTSAFAAKEKDAPGLLGKQARLASTLIGMHHGGSKKKLSYSNSKF